jgi:hypothetical protein
MMFKNIALTFVLAVAIELSTLGANLYKAGGVYLSVPPNAPTHVGTAFAPCLGCNPTVVAFDPGQDFGNNPGVFTVGVGGSNNLVLSGTTPNPVIDLNTHISLSDAAPITLTNPSSDTVITSASTAVPFKLYSNPGAATSVLVVDELSAPTTYIARFKKTGTDEFTIDPSGNVVAAGAVTATNGTFSGTLGVTGNATLSGGTLTLGASSTGVTLSPLATNAALTIGSQNATTAGSGVVLQASSLPTPTATGTPGGVLEIDVPSSSGTAPAAIWFKDGNTVSDGATTITVDANSGTDVLKIVAHGTCSSANHFLQLLQGGTSEFSINCNGATTVNTSLTYSTLLISAASCGTKNLPSTTPATCNGDSGFVKASGGSAVVNLGTSYSSANNYGCIAEDYTNNSYDPCSNSTASKITITSSGTDTIFWHTFGVSGG